MSLTKRVLAAVTVVVALTAVGAACGSSSDSSSGGSTESFCTTWNKFNETEDMDDLGDLDDPATMEKVTEAFNELEASAPSELKPSIKTMSDAIEATAGIAEDDIDALMEAMEKVDFEEVEAAQAKIEEYAEENCS